MVILGITPYCRGWLKSLLQTEGYIRRGWLFILRRFEAEVVVSETATTGHFNLQGRTALVTCSQVSACKSCDDGGCSVTSETRINDACGLLHYQQGFRELFNET